MDARTRDERLRQTYQHNAPVVNDDTFARHVEEATKGKKPKTFRTAHPRRRVAFAALAMVVVLGLIGFGIAELATSSGRDDAVVVITDDSMSPGVTSTGTETTAGATDSTTSDDYWPATTSSTTLFPQQHSFMQEASKDGYNVTMFTKQEGDRKVLVVWVILDSKEMTGDGTDAIFDYIVALAEKYDAAEAAGGRMRVELSDAPPGEFIKDYIFESRNFDLSKTTTSMVAQTTTSTTTTPAGLSVTMPNDFAFVAAYGVGAKNVLDTNSGTFIKDLGPQEDPAVTDLRLSQAQMEELYVELVELDPFSYSLPYYPDEGTTGPTVHVSTYQTYQLEIRMGGVSRDAVFWEDTSLSTHPKAVALRDWFDRLRQMIEATPEWKALPPMTGGYQ